MKKQLFFLIFLSIFVHTEASYLNKALRSIVPLTGFISTAFEFKNFYQTLQDKENYKTIKLNESQEDILLFNREKQEFLNNRIKNLYSSKKPLYFGVQDIEGTASARNYFDTNYIFYNYDLLPHIKETKKETFFDSAEDALEYIKISKEAHRKRLKEFYDNLPLKDLETALEKISITEAHEIGHLVHEHTRQEAEYNTILKRNSALASGLFNMYIMRNSFVKNISIMKIVSKVGAIVAAVPIIKLFSFYKNQEISRKNESEADDFALHYNQSRTALEDTKKIFQGKIQEEHDLIENFHAQNNHPFAIWLFKIFKKHFDSHPSYESRIEKIDIALQSLQDIKK